MSSPNSHEESQRAALLAEIAELQEELAATQRPRTRASLEADIAELQAQLAALDGGETPSPATAPVNQSGQAGGTSLGANNTLHGPTHIGDDVGRDKLEQQVGSVQAARDAFVATQQTINIYASEEAPVAPLLRTYLTELGSACARLSLADAESVDPKQATLDLQAVYVGLELERHVPLPPVDAEQLREQAISAIKEAGFAGVEEYATAYDGTVEQAFQFVIEQISPKEQQRRVRALEALAEHSRLVITGHPGSGKSSLVNFVALSLADAWCSGQPGVVPLGADWPHQALLPIRVVLREFAAWLEATPASAGDAAGLLWRWLEQKVGLAPLLVQRLRTACADGHAMLFLDGLDEVPLRDDGEPLRRVMATLHALGRGTSRMVVTCRVLDYEQAERQLTDWPVERIAPFAQPLREQLITHWFDALERLKRPTRGEPAILRDGLIRAIQARPELQRLAGNPLLLTMMIRLQAHDGELPGEQVTLYRRSVDLLLLQWRRDAAGREALGAVLALPQWSDSQLNRLLDRLAYVAHERGVSGESEQGADLPRQVLLEAAAHFFALYDPDRDLERAQKFLNYISAHGNGIIQRHDQQIYRFPHRTFQEYLAGRRLISDEGWPDDRPEFVDRALACSARGPQWRGALLLAVSQHALDGRLRPVFNLADELLARYRRGHATSDLLLAADILQELDRERVTTQRPELWEAIRTALLALLQPSNTKNPNSLPPSPAVVHERTENVHIAAKERIGTEETTPSSPLSHNVGEGAGGEGHPSHPNNLPALAGAERGRAGFLLGAFGDPRMPLSLTQWQHELAKLNATATDSYFCRIAAGDYLIGSGDDDSDAYDHERPQHTVTFAQDYWVARLPITNAQWQCWVAEGGTAAHYADDDDLNHPNQPVVGIDWHAATAYCAWLNNQLADLLPAGYTIRLPTEAEWEAAARGATARRYPWGNAWRDDGAATEEDRATRGWRWTMPVGCYPAGATPEGILDLAGNVWEWTLSRWHAYPGAKRSFTNDKLVVVRGGAFDNNRTFVRCGARGRNHPDDFLVIWGFRVILSPRSHIGSDF
ncbi:MAG: hypothetical protein EI684_03515 [Candidatus Viridilinea halotolerans]|uniref:AAA+ ATPase domain-containing protein n=1 Tax=Candidatus Viridilinea halotolerans TaxID=2491704 RepID=A0A426U7V9_9CHLR|nr:MAG: hypothetical protein EI684_03515 [Candidatus Viridilinea halotolerans]